MKAIPSSTKKLIFLSKVDTLDVFSVCIPIMEGIRSTNRLNSNEDKSRRVCRASNVDIIFPTRYPLSLECVYPIILQNERKR